MKQKILLTTIISLFLISLVSAQNIVNYYGSETCPHCINVKNSGVLDRVAQIEGVELTQYIIETKEGADAYFQLHAQNQNLPKGYPIVTIQCEDKFSYIVGDTPIINNLADAAVSCNDGEYKSSQGNMVLFIIVAIIILGILYFVTKKK